MGLIVGVLVAIIIAIALYAYLKVVYECVRKVKIIKRNSKYVTSKNAKRRHDNDIEIETVVEEYKQAPGPLPWPILGNLALLGQYDVPFQGFTELAKRYGDVYSLTLGTTRCLVVNKLNPIREVLNENGKFFGGRPDFLRFHKLFGGDRNNSLALCDWSQLQQKRRNLARKHCSPRDATSFFAKMSAVGCSEMREFMTKLTETAVPHEALHLKQIIQQTCANMFLQYMCSVRFDYGDEDFQMIVYYFDSIFWEINQGYAVDFLPWLSPFYKDHMNKIVHWSSTIRKFILERVVDDRERNLNVDEPEKDFTDALLKSLVEDNDVSRDTIIFMLEDFVGGHSAIGNLVMLSLAYIVRTPAVGKRIQAEVDEITEHGHRCVTLMDMDSMPFTVATIFEVLRYSSSPIVPHVATEDVEIHGFGVMKGTIVFINNYELNTSETYWTDPKQFDPSRFLETTTARTAKDDQDSSVKCKLKKNIPHFLPFSIGKRTCIGQNLVRGFGFIMLANIMQKYDVSCENLNDIKTYPACVAVPPDTFPLILTPRSL